MAFLEWLSWLFGHALHTFVALLPITNPQADPSFLDIQVDGKKSGPMLVFIHGFPDNLSLWDLQVKSLQDKYLCVRITLPNYNANKIQNKFGWDFVPIANLIVSTIEQVSRKYSQYRNKNGNNSGNNNENQVTLIMHDFGSLYGHLAYTLKPQLISNLVFVEVSDGARLSTKELILFLFYQFYLIFCFYMPRFIGKMFMILLLYPFGAPLIYPMIKWNQFSNDMCYTYVYLWKRKFGLITGDTYRDNEAVEMREIPQDKPIFFAYSKQFPIRFHSEAFKESLLERENTCFYKGYDGSHWLMKDKRTSHQFTNDLKHWIDQRHQSS